ncbi:MAG: hypothetical protein AAF656_07580 [Planctomycetota bacterium]
MKRLALLSVLLSPLLLLAEPADELSAELRARLDAIGTWDGVTESAELERPYEDPRQADIPFTWRSYYFDPWRAYMDTHPASRWSDGLGVVFNVNELSIEELDAAAAIAADAGITRARFEMGWGMLDWEGDALRPDRAAFFAELFRALAENDIRPMILLNAHHGAPCPRRNVRVEVAEAAEAGATRVRLADTANVRVNYTGFTGQAGRVAFPLITGIEDDGWVTLSAPLEKPIPVGRARLVELKYQPFAGATFADGSPNPAAQETLDGWLTYVDIVTRFAREQLDAAGAEDRGFDLEVWNEYSFGSDFLNDDKYFEPDRAFAADVSYSRHGRTREGHEIILPMTVDFTNDRRDALGDVGVYSGFSNQRPWDSGAQLWPGQRGFSKHPYADMRPGWWDGKSGLVAPGHETESFSNRRTFDALGELDGTMLPRDQRSGHRQTEAGSFFIPTMHIAMPEFHHTALHPTFKTRNVLPFPSGFRGQFRFAHNGDGRPAELVYTEHNLNRKPFADWLAERHDTDVDDPRITTLMHHLGTKNALRTFAMSGHKGVGTVFLFALKRNDHDYAMVPEAWFDRLAANGHELDAALREDVGPQLAALGNVSRVMASGRAVDVTRRLTVTRVVEHRPRLVFRGEGTTGRPDLFHRDDLVVLPYQLDDDRFAIIYYVATRNLMHAWHPDADELDPTRYDMPEQRFDLTFDNLRGTGLSAEALDPMRDEVVDVDVLESAATSVTLAVQATDYPRVLILDEATSGPVLRRPALRVGDDGVAVVAFETEAGEQVRVTWGELPERTGGTWTGPAKPSVEVPLPNFKPGEHGVRIIVESGGLTTTWPDWGWSNRGVLHPE